MKRIIFLLSICFLIISFGCEVPPTSYYNFQVTSTYAGFSGYYSIDGEDKVFFSDEIVSENGVFYEYQLNLDSPEYIYIYVIGDSIATKSIQIHIYVDSTLVEDIKNTPEDSDDLVDIEAKWDFDSSSDTDS